MNGWIKLHRTLIEWEWISEPLTLAVFINLLIEASNRECSWKGQKLLPGQLVFGRKAFSERTGISVQSVRTALEHLKSTNELTIKTTNKYSVISINNWDKYQETNQPTNQQSTSNQPATNHIVRSKEDKNINTVPKIKIPKTEKTYTESKLSLEEVANRLLKHFNEENKTNYRNIKVFVSNLEKSLEVYQPEDIADAITQIKFDKFWKDKMKPETLFRQKNPQGEAVDWIGVLLNSKKEHYASR